jgi:hypothetical protein
MDAIKEQAMARGRHRLSVWQMVGFSLALAVGAFAASARPALAHTRVEIGPYTVVVGWLHEPPIVGERNALIVEIAQGNTPVEGAEAGLDLELLYGGRTFRANLAPTTTAGLYTADLFPTVRGQYEMRLFGTLGNTAVDETLEPEEVFSAERLQFPEAQPDPLDLQTQLNALQGQVQTSRRLALGGLIIGLAGVGLAAFTLWQRPSA